MESPERVPESLLKQRGSFKKSLSVAVIVLALLVLIATWFYFPLGFYFGLTIRDGSNVAEKLGTLNYFQTKDYDFLISFPGKLRITNRKTGQFREFDGRTFGCQHDYAYLEKVAYENNVLYTSETQDWWPHCDGGFKRIYYLNF